MTFVFPAAAVTSTPYSKRYLARLCASIDQLRPAHKQDAAMLIALAAGAGLRAVEIARATGPFDPDRPVVTATGFRELSPRQVAVSTAVAGALRPHLFPVPPGEFLLRPERVATTARVPGRFAARAWPAPADRPNLRRLRSSWIVGALSTGIDPSCLSDLAGTCDLTPYVGWARIPATPVTDPRLIVPGTPGVWEVHCA